MTIDNQNTEPCDKRSETQGVINQGGSGRHVRSFPEGEQRRGRESKEKEVPLPRIESLTGGVCV